MNDKTLHDVYEALANAIDAVGPEKEALLLAKIALLLANELNNPAKVLEMIAAAETDLASMRSSMSSRV